MESLAANLNQRIAALARRVRLLRMQRGFSLMGLFGVFLFLGIFAVDVWLEMPPWGLTWAFTALLAGTLGVGLFGLVVPLCRRLDTAALAALIEEKYPELGERLTSTVELAQAGPGHGDAVLVDLLRRETANQVAGLDFFQAYPGKWSRRLGVVAGLALVAAVLPAFFLDAYADFSRSLFTSWWPAVPYELQVEPGNTVAAKGRPLTVTARVVGGRRAGTLPDQCFLVYDDGPDGPKPIRMTPQGENQFSYTFGKVEDHFRYQVKAGAAGSDFFRVTAVEPVDLAANSPKVSITPPSYVKTTKPAGESSSLRGHEGVRDFSVLQFSQVRWHFHFTRPATEGKIRFAASQRETGENTTSKDFAVALSSNRLEGTLELPAAGPGSFALTLTLADEHQIITVKELGTVTIWADAPPRVIEISRGLTTAKSKARPEEIVPLQVAAEDDVGLHRVEIEYRINTEPSRFETILLAEGQKKAFKDYSFLLKDKKLKEGDELRYRLKASDRRQVKAKACRDFQGNPVPKEKLDANITYTSWIELTIASPLRETDIVAQHENFTKQIAAIKKKLEREQGQIKELRPQARAHPTLLPVQAQNLGAIRDFNAGVSKDLSHLAREAGKFAPFLADLAQDIADTQMYASDRALGRAQDPHAKADQRDQDLALAENAVAEAIKRLEDLTRHNARLAQDRLDQWRMERLAERQEELAKRGADLAAREPTPEVKAELDRLRQEQNQLVEELHQLTQKSRLFRDALEAARKEFDARPLVEKANDLADKLHAMNKEFSPPNPGQEKKLLEDLAKKQEALADKATQLARDFEKTKTKVTFLPDPAHRAAKALTGGQLAEALNQQNASLLALERVAQDLDSGLPLARDPRRAARQLVQMQAALKKKLEKFGEELPRLSAEERSRQLPQILREQNSLAKAIGRLDLAEYPKAKDDRQQAANQADQVEKQANALQALQQMDQAHQALARLAQRLPPPPPTADPEPANTAEEKIRQGQAARARQLAQEQRLLRDLLEKILAAKNPSPEQTARQRELQEETNQLLKDLIQLSQNEKSPKAKAMAQHAMNAAEKALQALKKADGEPDADLAKKARDEAAKRLDEASRQAEEALKLAMTKKETEGLGQALAKGQDEAGQAKKDLQQGRPKQAPPHMKNAAQALQQSASLAEKQWQIQRSKPTVPGNIPGMRGPTAGVPAALLPKGTQQFAGRPWGDLPDELRTRIVQDMRGRFGDDYARIIQGYFEGLADPNRP